MPSLPKIGRSSRIRTYDLLVPNQAHYQAVLYSGSWWATLESNQACFSASNLQSDVTPCEHAARCWHRCRESNPGLQFWRLPCYRNTSPIKKAPYFRLGLVSNLMSINHIKTNPSRELGTIYTILFVSCYSLL